MWIGLEVFNYMYIYENNFVFVYFVIELYLNILTCIFNVIIRFMYLTTSVRCLNE